MFPQGAPCCIRTMALCVRNVLVLSWLAWVSIRGEVSVQCGQNSVFVRWTESESETLTDPWFLRLGECLPSSVSVRPGGAEVVFHARFDDCSFRRMVTEDELVFENELLLMAPSKTTSNFSSPVVCVYERPAGWSPPVYDPVRLQASGQADLVFHMSFMKADFSDVATSTAFSLGSLIPIAAAVEQLSHQPLLLLLEECVASTTPELTQDSKVYPIIANKGCLVDSKKSNSRFLPRQSPSEIRLYLQAFMFANGEEVYIHCNLVAWDPKDMNGGRKACQYDKQNGRWELLDSRTDSALCVCCDSKCRTRKRRETRKGLDPTSHWRLPQESLWWRPTCEPARGVPHLYPRVTMVYNRGVKPVQKGPLWAQVFVPTEKNPHLSN